MMQEAEKDPEKEATYRGNTYDLIALASLIMGLAAIFACSYIGIPLLGLVALILGVIALVKAPAAIEPSRTRLFSILGIGGALLVLLVLVAFILFYIWMFTWMFSPNSPYWEFFTEFWRTVPRQP